MHVGPLETVQQVSNTQNLGTESEQLDGARGKAYGDLGTPQPGGCDSAPLRPEAYEDP